MNCKPGDLAVVVRLNPSPQHEEERAQVLGKPVRVVSVSNSPLWVAKDVWLIERPFRFFVRGRSFIVDGERAPCKDGRNMKKLKIWNGRPYGILPYAEWQNGDAHVYVAAYSIKDIWDLCRELGLPTPSKNEITVYWSKGCWGNSMEGIPVERGIWSQADRFSKPVRRMPLRDPPR